MRRFALAALAVIILPALALAADPVNRTPRVAAPVQPVLVEEPGPAWNRSGLYVAALAGYNTAVLETEGIDLNNGKLMGGGAIGYNQRLDRYVLGIEADFLFTDIKASTTVEGYSVTASNRHLASVRGRAGMALGPALIYGTVGPAWQGVKVTVDGIGSSTEWQLGWVAGGGMEIEITKSFALRLEALRYEFDKDGLETSHTVARAGTIFKF